MAVVGDVCRLADLHHVVDFGKPAATNQLLSAGELGTMLAQDCVIMP